MNVIRLANISSYVRLCAHKQLLIPCSIISINDKINPLIMGTPSRSYAIQSSVESFIKTQRGIFQTLSESVPVEYLQNFLISVHDQCGLPWWATILCITALLRSCITVPFGIYQQSIFAKIENITLEMPAIAKELQKEVAIAVHLYKWDERMAQFQYRMSLKKQWNNLVVRENCHPFKAGVLLLFQMPLWVCYSMSLRNLVYLLPNQDMDALIRYTELSVGGFGWIPNLTVPDSTYILPIALGIINLVIIEIQLLAKTSPPSRLQRYATNFFRGVSIIMVPVAMVVPSCLVVYWTASSTYGLFQNLALMSPKVKRFCRIPRAPSEVQNPYQHVINNFKNKYLNYWQLK